MAKKNKKQSAVIFTGFVKIDKNLVGTAVIYKKIADMLLQQEGYQVDMVVPEFGDLKDKIVYHTWDAKNNKRLINAAQVVVFGAYPPIEPMYYAWQKNKVIMTYLWSIAPIGSMEFRDFPSLNKQRKLHQYISASYNLSLLLSDKIFCRNTSVRNLLMGSLLSLGRVDLKNYSEDRRLQSLVEVAPFGLESRAPIHKKDVYRDQVPGIAKKDFLLIWNGGIWNWNDGETLMKTMRLLRDKHGKKDIKLILQGFEHPDKNQKMSEEAQKTLRLARRYKLINDTVFFTQWVAFNERGNYLTECDAGIVTSPDIPEANLFLKTRVYDYLWAELPVIIGDNEAFAPFVKKMGLGVISICARAEEWAENIVKLYSQPAMQKAIKTNIRAVKKEMTWTKTLRGVKRFLKNPTRDSSKKLADKKILHDNIKNNLRIIKGGL